MKRHASMNRLYRIIWSEAKQTFIVAAEIAKGHCRSVTQLHIDSIDTASGINEPFLAPPVAERSTDYVTLASSIARILGVSLLGLSAAQAGPAINELPNGGVITQGSGTISQHGTVLTVQQNSDKMIGQWNSFNIGQNATVNFQQPNSGSIALNRVNDQKPSDIEGHLNANGQVYLLNANGVIFGKTAEVNAGGIVVSTQQLSDQNFLNNKAVFTENSGSNNGSIENQGQITAHGGVVAFIAPEVNNSGTIQNTGGTVALAAGQQVTLDFNGDGLVNVKVDQAALNALAANHGLIQANAGTVIMTAQSANAVMDTVVNNDGVIQAKTLQNQGGRIVLDGGDAGVTVNSGALDVSAASGIGGQIIATGDKVIVDNGSNINASGANGGGEILVGGSWQNSDASLKQATGAYVAQTAVLQANATDKGDGGTIVVRSVNNSNSVTRAYGDFEAKGGANGGNGGRIETSGHWLDVANSKINASAAKGQAGEWLLDPYNVVISSTTSGTSYNSPYSSFTPTDDSTILASNISDALSNGSNVTITTGSSGSSIGDISVNSAITKTGGGSAILSLQAADTITINAQITSNVGALNVQLYADHDYNGVGVDILNSNISTNGGYINFGDGQLTTINGISNTLVGGDVYIGGSSAINLNTAGGAVTINGQMLIANTAGLNINTSGGNVSFKGLLDSGDTYAFVNLSPPNSLSWTAAEAAAKTGTGANVGDTYLATITTRLENAVASYNSGYHAAWIGGERITGIGTNNVWRWVTGPEGLMNGGLGLAFFTQNGSNSTNGSGGTAINGAYSNWNTGEPNNNGGTNLSNGSANGVGEFALQFTGTLGRWNDLNASNTSYTAGNGSIFGYTIETNLAASPLTVSAGSGTVTFSSAVGANKALETLNVTAATIAINGGSVTTQSTQTYNGAVTLGSASTTLTQTNPNTDFTLPSGKSISNATGADASLFIETTGAIIMATNSSIFSNSGKLNTVLWADTDASNGGYISLNDNAAITTNGGNLWLGGGSGSTTWNGLTVGNGYAQGENTGNPAGIFISNGAISTGGGNIAMYGESTAGNFSGSNPDGQANAAGIVTSFNNQYHINAGTGTILLNAKSVDVNSGAIADALYLNGGTLSSAASSGDAITMIGDASAANIGNASHAAGIAVIGWNATKSNTISATGGGNIVLNGSGANNDANAGNLSSGIRLDDASNGVNTLLTSGGGNITLTGTTADSGANSLAISTNTADVISSSGTLQVNGSNRDINLAAKTTVSGTTTFSDGGHNISATNSLNAFGGAVTVSTGNNIALVNAAAMTLGSITAGGTINAATLTGNLTVAGNINTTDATTSAITLNASQNSSAGDAGGGDILISGSPSISSNGRTTLYTGSISGSTNLSTEISAKGNSRYASDELNTHFTTPLGNSGVYAIYRQQPTISVTPGLAAMTYTGLTDTAGPTASYSGFVNGDTNSVLAGTLNYSGTYQTAVNAGSYTIIASGLNNGLGYAINYVTGGLTINAAPLTITANAAAQFVGLADPGNNYNGVTYTGFVHGETSTVLSATPTVTRIGSETAAGVYSGELHPGTVTANHNNYTISYLNGSYTIVPANELLVTVDNLSTTYGAAANYTVSSAKYLYSGDNQIHSLTFTDTNNQVTVDDHSGTTASFALTALNPTLSTAGLLATGNYAIGANGLAVTGANFNSSNLVVIGNQTVTPLAITLNPGGLSNTYNGTTAMTALSLGLSGKENNDQVTVSGTGNFIQSNVGVNLNYTVTNLQLNGHDAGDYYLNLNGSSVYTGNNGAIIPAPLTVTANSTSMVYGNSLPTFTSSLSGFVNGETLTTSGVFGNAAFSSNAGSTSNVGNSYTITPSLGTLTASNYSFNSFVNGTLTITPRPINLVGTKVYNGGTTISANAFSASNLVNGDCSSGLASCGLSISGSLSSANVGTQSLNLNQFTLGSGLSNYTLNGATDTLTITPAVISLTGSRSYNGTSNVNSGILTLSGMVNSETLNLAGVGSVASPNVANNLAISFAGLTLANGSGLASNYTLTGGTDLLNITPAPLTVTANPATMIYGNPLPTFTDTISGFVNGETLVNSGVHGNANFSTRASSASNVGNGYTITPSLGSLTAGNYSFNTFNNGTLTITPRPLNLVGTQIYNGGTSISASAFSATNLVNGDCASGLVSCGLSGSASIGNPNVGGSQSVNLSTLSLGSGLSNYILVGGMDTVSITPASLFVTANNDSKIQDGLAYNGGNGVSYSGFVNGENAAILGGTLSYTGTSQGAVFVGQYSIIPTGLFSNNYQISYPNGILNITDRVSGGQQVNAASTSVVSSQVGTTGTSTNSTGSNLNSGNPIPQSVTGPSTGSQTITLAQNDNLITTDVKPVFTTTGSMLLSTNTGNNPVSFSQTDSGGLTLSLNGESGNSSITALAENADLPLFNASSGVVIPQNTLKILESSSSLSALPTNSLPTSIPSLPNKDTPPQSNGSLIRSDGGTISFTIDITKEGMLVISVPKGSLENLDTQQLVLSGLATAKQNLDISITKLKGIIIQ